LRHTRSASVTLALLPRETKLKQLAERGLSPGLLSAGLGSVPAEQTYLDITQGNRIFDSLYDEELPSSERCGPAFWRAVIERAESAPAEIEPGLLQSTLGAARIGVRVGVGTSCTFSEIRPRTAAAGVRKKLSGDPHPHPSQTFEVRSSSLRDLSSLVRNLRNDDLLIAVERPPPARDRALAIGIAGRGFDGNLTSDSTRTEGYVLSTDIAPTILERLGVAIPSAISGQPIRSQGSVDPAAVESLGDRMAVISGRRGPVIGLALAIWLGALALALAATRGSATAGIGDAGIGRRGKSTRLAVKLVGLSVVYLPLVLLLGAALEAGQGVEQLIVILGAPLLGLLTLVALGGYRALAVASGVTVLAYAVDVVAGSPLTSLSLLGPNPGLGVRFYGIGNELEALLAVLVVAGTGAALTGFAPQAASYGCVALVPHGEPRATRLRAAAAFLAVGLVAAGIFAAGRFGADVGAAIVLPLGAAVAAATIAARRRRTALLVIAAPVVAVALLALADLLSGANAHLTRSVLDAGGLDDLAQVAQRRLQLSAHSFSRPVVFVFMPLIAAAAALAIVRRDRLAAWLHGRDAMRAGLIGAVAATVVGTLANDSGALLLEIGTAYLLVFTAFAWAESGAGRRAGAD
jgi:hypothetical protein